MGTRLTPVSRALGGRDPDTAMAAVAATVPDWSGGTGLGEQLARLARRVVWVNPHKGRDGYAPLTGGIRAALPWVDDFVAGHSLAAMEKLAQLLSGRVRGA